jgi:hypothetical protein
MKKGADKKKDDNHEPALPPKQNISEWLAHFFSSFFWLFLITSVAAGTRKCLGEVS